MRKLYILMLTLLATVGLVSTSFARSEPGFESWSNKSVNVGRESNPVRILKLVRNSAGGDNGVTIVSGDAVVYDTNSDDSVSVRVTTTSADGAFAGIAASQILSSDASAAASAFDDIGRRNWGYIIVHGPANANTTTSGTNGNAAGDLFVTSTDAGKITGTSSNSTVTATGAEVSKVVRGKGGFFYSADNASTVALVFVENE